MIYSSFIKERISEKNKKYRSRIRFYLWLLLFIIKELTVGVVSRVCILLNRRDMLRMLLRRDENYAPTAMYSLLQDMSRQYAKTQPNLVAQVFDGMSHFLSCHGHYEGHIQRCLAEELFPKLESKYIALDLGANIGIYSCFFSQHFTKTYAFEMIPVTAKILQFNMELHATNQVKVVPMGVSNSNGSATAYTASTSSATNSLSASDKYRNNAGWRSANPQLTEQTITTCRVDNAIPQDEHNRIAFIKMDVEDYEIQALEGMPEILKKSKPVIGFEALKNSFDEHGNQPVIQYLKEHGYKHFYEANRKSRLVKRDIFPIIAYEMIIATHDEIL